MNPADLILTDAAISHQIDLMRFTAGEKRKVDALLLAVLKELKYKLNNGLSDYGKARVRVLLREANEVIAQGYSGIQAELDFNDLATLEAETISKTFAAIGLEASLPTEAMLKALVNGSLIEGAPSSAWWAKQSQDLQFRFAAQVRQGIAQNETVMQIVRRIAGSKRLGTVGIMEVARRNAFALVHTSIQQVANDARLATFRANSDIIKGVRQLSTLDGHTCWSQETKILMADGSQKPIGVIITGDYVVGGLTAKPCKVVAIEKIVLASSVEIRYYNGKIIGRTTHGHRMLTKTGWKEVGDLCLLPDISRREVLCRSFGEAKAPHQAASAAVGGWDSAITERRMEKERRTGVVDTGGDNKQGSGLSSGKALHQGVEYESTVWPQHDGRREGDRRTIRGIFQGVGEETVREVQDGPGIQGEDACGSNQGRAEGCRGKQAVLCNSRRQTVHEGKNGIGLACKDNSLKSAPQDSEREASDEGRGKKELAGPRISGEGERSEGGAAGRAKENRSYLGKFKSKENGGSDEREVERPCIPGKDEDPEATSPFLGKAPGNMGKTESIMDPRGACYPYGEGEIAILERENVKGAGITGKERIEPVEIISLSIEGDVSYVAGGVIVHNSTTCIAYSGGCWDLTGKPIMGTKLPFNGGTPRHWNCRSLLVGITKTYRELGVDIDEVPTGTRASDEGQIRADITFAEFLKGKPAAYVDDLLGPGRADLWRKGKITLQQLVDGSGRELTLKELRGRL